MKYRRVSIIAQIPPSPNILVKSNQTSFVRIIGLDHYLRHVTDEKAAQVSYATEITFVSTNRSGHVPSFDIKLLQAGLERHDFGEAPYCIVLCLIKTPF